MYTALVGPGEVVNIQMDIGVFLLAVVQVILLVGSEKWMEISCIQKTFGSFHHQV